MHHESKRFTSHAGLMTVSTQVSTSRQLTFHAADEETHTALMTAGTQAPRIHAADEETHAGLKTVSTQVNTTRQLTFHAADEETQAALMTASTQVSTTCQMKRPTPRS